MRYFKLFLIFTVFFTLNFAVEGATTKVDVLAKTTKSRNGHKLPRYVRGNLK